MTAANEVTAMLANMLSGLAMFDILPALATLDHFSRDRVLGRARSALSPGAAERVQFAAAVVTTLRIPRSPAALPNDQVEDARRFLVSRLKPANSQAGLASYSSMNAAAIQALDEVAAVTTAVCREFAGNFSPEDARGKALGIELTAPQLATVEQLNAVMTMLGQEPLQAQEWAPLKAA